MQTKMYGDMTEDEADKAIDDIYYRIDNLLRADKFDAVADILDGVDMDQPTVILLAYLSITVAPKYEIGIRRASYAARVRSVLTKGYPTRVEELLSGLE
jgi:hypothetical protein